MKDLQSNLNDLAHKIASFHEPASVSDTEWEKFTSNTIVALTAGGESSRYSAALKGQDVNKNAHELPNGDTMIEMTIRMYRDAGIKKFVALVFHNAHSVQDRVGNGSNLGVEVTYSQDPEQAAGTGGAIRNALENGSIPKSSNLIVSNPCDIFFDRPDNFVRRYCESHIEGENQGMLATAILTRGIPIPATGMLVQDNRVIDAQKFPFVPIPSHVGISIFSPKLYPRFKKIFDLTKKTDFEQLLFPALAKEEKLWSAFLTHGLWVQVKDLKGYKELVDRLR
ncbi:MAG TPA: sugar phosphate nucleotidyltransferase [Candidatus Babeliales bacterium]|nr:sugar phosphate nucleotidyltransferase [Candidatus Babeliales bacterium]